MTKKDVKIICADKFELDGLLLEPEGEVKLAILLNSATATPKTFYISFASFLAENGFAVLLYDYRGIGGSIPKTGLKGFDVKYLDWSQLDMTAAMEYLDKRYPKKVKIIFGHSVGGQKVGFMPNLSKAKAMITVATSVGYWHFMPLFYKIQTLYFFYIIAPITHTLFGYTATKKLGIMENLPKGITLDWRRWCSVPDYFFNKEEYGITVPTGAYKDFPIPVKVYYASDDPISNERSVNRFWSNVISKHPIEIVKLNPKDFNRQEIGHFGFFNKRSNGNIWELALNDLKNYIN